jgi:hypothetical protein
MATGILDQLGRTIETHGLAVEQPAQEGGRFEAFDPG